MPPPTLAERMVALERDVAALRHLIDSAMEDPESIPAGRRAARWHETADRERAELFRRVTYVEKELRALVRWASGSR